MMITSSKISKKGTKSKKATRLKILNAVAFQVAWLICVLLGDLAAVISLAVVLVVHYIYFRPTQSEWLLISSIGFFGCVLDSLLVNIGVLELAPLSVLGLSLAPLWLLCLWVAFATTLMHSLSFLQKRIWLCSVLSIISAPWAYYSGALLQGISLSLTSVCIVALLWAVWLPLAMLIARRYVVVQYVEELQYAA